MMMEWKEVYDCIMVKEAGDDLYVCLYVTRQDGKTVTKYFRIKADEGIEEVSEDQVPD